jgi:hypothetical protein
VLLPQTANLGSTQRPKLVDKAYAGVELGVGNGMFNLCNVRVMGKGYARDTIVTLLCEAQ